MSRPLTALAVVLGLATAIVVALIITSSSGDDGRAAKAAPSQDVTRIFDGIPQDNLILGSPAAKVLLVEVADPQCPFCKQFAEESLPAIVRRYVRTGKIRLEMRLARFLGPDSERGARALLAAGRQDRLWQAAARFYAMQGQENSGYATDAFLRQVLGGIRGLDVRRAMAERAHQAVDAELGAVNNFQSRYGVKGTPTLLIGTDDANLRPVAAQVPSVEQLSASIEAELAKHH